GPGHKLPAGVEVAERGASGVVVVSGGVVDVGRQPDDVAHPSGLEEREQLCYLELPAESSGLPWAMASIEDPSGTTSPMGMSAAITFHVACDDSRAPFSHCNWRRPRNGVAGPGAGWSSVVFGPR